VVLGVVELNVLEDTLEVMTIWTRPVKAVRAVSLARPEKLARAAHLEWQVARLARPEWRMARAAQAKVEG
jgi:hypothetical protein